VSIVLTGAERRQNFALLQAIADAIGREFESKPYDELLLIESAPPLSRTVDGIVVSVSARARRRPADDALSVSVDIRSDLPTPLGARPTYTFRKRRDGSVFY
jgi:hypothetical protein